MKRYDGQKHPAESQDYIRRVMKHYMDGLTLMTNAAIENVERAGLPHGAAQVLVANMMASMSIMLMQKEGEAFSMKTVDANRALQIAQAQGLFETKPATKQ